MNPEQQTSNQKPQDIKSSINSLLKNSKAFSSFSVNDIDKAKKFYGDTLGLNVSQNDEMGTLMIIFADGNELFVYPKSEHKPASFTVLNFPVPDIEVAVMEFKKNGITFEQYEGELKTDENGIFRDGDFAMAWFKDPAGNVVSILEESENAKKH